MSDQPFQKQKSKGPSLENRIDKGKAAKDRKGGYDGPREKRKKKVSGGKHASKGKGGKSSEGGKSKGKVGSKGSKRAKVCGHTWAQGGKGSNKNRILAFLYDPLDF